MSGKPHVYSYSSISKFETCPYQWEAQYVLKTIKFIPNETTTWGQETHDALDKRLKTKQPLPERFMMFEKYAKAVEALPGTLKSEYEMALDAEGNRVGWWDKTAYERGKSDVSVFHDDRCQIVDWKTGSYRPNTEELDYFSLLTFKIHPEVEKIKTTYLWFKNDGPPTIAYWDRKQLDELASKFAEKIDRIERARVNDVFPSKKSGLCKQYCGRFDCKHNGRKS